MAEVAVIIVHYKVEEDTRICIESFYKNLSKGIMPIVVINSASDDFRKRLKQQFPDLVVIHSSVNLGVAQGNNEGIKKALDAGCKYFILLNNDTIVSPNLFDNLVKFSQNNDEIGIVSPKIYFAKGYEYHKDRYKKHELGKIIWYAGGLIDWGNIYASHRGVDEFDNGQYDKIIETDFVTGCCMMIKREVIERVGLLDEKYFLYFEDVDYSLRTKKEKFQVVYFPGAHLWHKNASSSDKPGSFLHRYYLTRNRLYFGYKYASWRTKKSLFAESLRQLTAGGIEKKGVVDYYLGHMGRKDKI